METLINELELQVTEFTATNLQIAFGGNITGAHPRQYWEATEPITSVKWVFSHVLGKEIYFKNEHDRLFNLSIKWSIDSTFLTDLLLPHITKTIQVLKQWGNDTKVIAEPNFELQVDQQEKLRGKELFHVYFPIKITLAE